MSIDLRISHAFSSLPKIVAIAVSTLIFQSFILPSLQPVVGQVSEDTLTVELSPSGEASIVEEITPSTTVSRISVIPVSPKISNFLAVDESDIILRSVLINGTIQIDSLGAAYVRLTYDAEILNRTGDIWNVQYRSMVDSKIIIPSGSELLFVNNIPLDIVEDTITMPAGEVAISYRTRGVTADTFTVSWNGTDYQVGILGASGVRSLNFEQASKSITLGLNSRAPLLVIIPKILLEGPYEVRGSAGAQDVQFKEYYQNASHTWVRVEPSSNTNSIRIIGTTVIPEFQFSSMAMAGLIFSVLLTLFYASRKWTILNK